MFAYAVATLAMIERIGRPNEGRDVWYADDASACAPLCHMKDWFSELLDVGQSVGYYPEPKKYVLHIERKKLLNLGSNSWSSLPGSDPLAIRLLGTKERP